MTIDEETQAVVSRIVNHSQPSRVILFGSRGRGNQRTDSDIDLCVLYGHLEKHNVEIMEELYLELWGHKTSPVDLAVYDEAAFLERAKRRNSFEATIQAEGVTVYG